MQGDICHLVKICAKNLGMVCFYSLHWAEKLQKSASDSLGASMLCLLMQADMGATFNVIPASMAHNVCNSSEQFARMHWQFTPKRTGTRTVAISAKLQLWLHFINGPYRFLLKSCWFSRALELFLDTHRFSCCIKKNVQYMCCFNTALFSRKITFKTVMQFYFYLFFSFFLRK